ncbi:MAG: transcription antitermination protein NusB [Phycisphaerales bacterium JB037]
MKLPETIRELASQTLLQIGSDEPSSASVASFSEELRLLGTVEPSQRLRAFDIAARRLACQLLYRLDLHNATDAEAADMIDQDLDAIDGLGPVLADRVRAITLGAWGDRASTDHRTLALAPGWPATRQPAMDRAILRLAIHQLSLAAEDPRIIINEAVELAKSFGTERSPAFVNGILGKVARGEPAPHAEPPAESPQHTD